MRSRSLVLAVLTLAVARAASAAPPCARRSARSKSTACARSRAGCATTAATATSAPTSPTRWASPRPQGEELLAARQRGFRATTCCASRRSRPTSAARLHPVHGAAARRPGVLLPLHAARRPAEGVRLDPEQEPGGAARALRGGTPLPARGPLLEGPQRDATSHGSRTHQPDRRSCSRTCSRGPPSCGGIFDFEGKQKRLSAKSSSARRPGGLERPEARAGARQGKESRSKPSSAR